MTTPNEQDLRALAYLAPRLRPRGSKPWKDTDTYDCCDRLRKTGVNLQEIANRVLIHAQDAKAQAPTVIAVPPKHEPVTESTAWRPPKADDACPTHGGWAGNCSGCGGDRLTGTTTPKRTTRTPLDPRGFEIARDAIAAAKADRRQAETAHQAHKNRPRSDEQATSGVQCHHDDERTAE